MCGAPHRTLVEPDRISQEYGRISGSHLSDVCVALNLFGNFESPQLCSPSVEDRRRATDPHGSVDLKSVMFPQLRSDPTRSHPEVQNLHY